MHIHERPFASLRALTFVAPAVVVLSCSAGTTLIGDSGISPSHTSSASPYPSESITSRQIATIPVENAYEAVQQLRPMFLVARPGSGRPPVPPCAIIGKGFPEVLEMLKLVPASSVIEIRRLVPQEAVTAYGTACPGGVLLVRVATPSDR